MSRVAWRSFLGLMLIAAAYGGWQIYLSARFSAQRSVSKTNLKQIGLALHQYHDQYGSFPPAYVLGPDEKPWHSWRVLLLPFLGEKELYSQYRFDEPWDGPSNRKLLASGPAVYTSPLQKNLKPGTASYLAVVSRRTMWPAYFPVRIEDVTDGISNTIQLVEDIESDIGWTEPRDLRERSALAMLKTGKTPHADQSSDRFYILMADGSPRLLSPYVNRQLFIALLTPRATELMIDDARWPKGVLGNEAPTASKLPDIVGLDQFPGTRLLVVPEEPIPSDQSHLYCATVQIAWDQLRPKKGGPVTTSDATPLITALNAHPFPLEALAEETYFASVSGLDDQNSRQLFDRLLQKFPGAPSKRLQPPQIDGELDRGLRVIAYLRKSMPFTDVMERYPDPLPFPKDEPQRRVESFGWPSSTGEGGGFPVLQQTVAIRDYVSDDDFIVSLLTESPQGDEILLAKMTPDETLQTSWERVVNRVSRPQGSHLIEHLRGVDQLQIPILSFGLEGNLPQLSGVSIPMTGHPDRFIAVATQMIQFRLDEYGAELIADTQMVVGENGHGPDLKPKPLTPRRFVFDQLFLLAIRESKAEVPYFLAWIGNADLMESAK